MNNFTRFTALVTGLICLAITNTLPAAGEEFPENVVCDFTSGTATTFGDGSFSSTVPKPLSFKIARVNLDKQSAELIGSPDHAPGQLKIVRAINANHFIEIVNEGYMNLTTIYDADPKSGKHPAVHSRHLGILGQPIFAQYTGLCTPQP